MLDLQDPSTFQGTLIKRLVEERQALIEERDSLRALRRLPWTVDDLPPGRVSVADLPPAPDLVSIRGAAFIGGVSRQYINTAALDKRLFTSACNFDNHLALSRVEIEQWRRSRQEG